MTPPLRRQLTAAALACVISLGGCLGTVGNDPEEKPLPEVDARLFEYDRKQPLRARSELLKTRRGLSVERVSYAAADGERVPALFAKPRRGSSGPCVIFEDGFGSTKEAAAPVWATFAADGIATFSIDPRFHGTRADGRITSQRAALEPGLLFRMLRGTVVDLRRGIDYLEGRQECDPRRIGYIGASFGGMVGAILAGVDGRVQAPALLVSGGDWRSILEGTDIFLPRIERSPARFRRALRLLAPLDPARWIGHISPRPVLLVNGDRDETVVETASRALREGARDPRRVIIYQGDHDDFLSTPLVGEELREWVRAKLAKG